MWALSKFLLLLTFYLCLAARKSAEWADVIAIICVITELSFKAITKRTFERANRKYERSQSCNWGAPKPLKTLYFLSQENISLSLWNSLNEKLGPLRSITNPIFRQYAAECVSVFWHKSAIATTKPQQGLFRKLRRPTHKKSPRAFLGFKGKML